MANGSYTVRDDHSYSHNNHPKQNSVAAKIQELKSQSHSCLTCTHTKVAYGNMLRCSAKANKYIHHYNICAEHKVVEPRIHTEE